MFFQLASRANTRLTCGAWPLWFSAVAGDALPGICELSRGKFMRLRIARNVFTLSAHLLEQ
jgi:hypothetical protein